MIRTNKPLSILIDYRSAKSVTGIISISILALTLNASTGDYEVTIRDTIDNSILSQRTVKITKLAYEQVKAAIIANNSYTEVGTDLDLKIMPEALLYYVTTDVRADGKLIYNTTPADWELTPVEPA